MRTFVPFSDFKLCASVLPNALLKRQVQDAIDLFGAMGKPPANELLLDPMLHMWRHNVMSLYRYTDAMLHEYEKRVHKHKSQRYVLKRRLGEVLEANQFDQFRADPWWLNDPRLLRSHRSALMRKDVLFKGVSDDIPMWHPMSAVGVGEGTALVGYYDKDLDDTHNWSITTPSFNSDENRDALKALGIHEYRGYAVSNGLTANPIIANSVLTHCMERHSKVLLYEEHVCDLMQVDFDAGRSWTVHQVKIIVVGATVTGDVRRVKEAMRRA